jgi:hypothetical protein
MNDTEKTFEKWIRIKIELNPNGIKMIATTSRFISLVYYFSQLFTTHEIYAKQLCKPVKFSAPRRRSGRDEITK